MRQVWTGCSRCELDVAGVERMWRMWTGCSRCELDVAGVEQMWQVWTEDINIQTGHQLLNRKELYMYV